MIVWTFENLVSAERRDQSNWGKTFLNKERTNIKLNPLMVSLLGPSNIRVRRVAGLFLAFHLQLPCEQRLHFRGVSWSAKVVGRGYFSASSHSENVASARRITCSLLGKRPRFCKRQRSKHICESKWVNLSFWPDLNCWYINVWFLGYCRPTSEAQDSKVWSFWGRYEKRVSWTQCFSVPCSNFEHWVQSINERVPNPLKERPIDAWSLEPHVTLD